VRRGDCTSRRDGLPLLTIFLEEKQMNKTAKEMVADALTNALIAMWRESNPYDDPEDYTADFQRMCERQLYFILKTGLKKNKENTND
jgi:hypothetical protein